MKSLTNVALCLALAAPGFAQQAPATAPSSAPTATEQAGAPAPKKVDRAAAYYHFALAHLYEELVAVYGKQEFASKAIEEYRLAMEADPSSEFLPAGLAELYAKTGRIRDAVLEAQDILKRDPNNLEARKLLGRIYLRSLGDMNSGTQSAEILRLAIEQYEQIVRIDPGNIDHALLLGRLYSLNKDFSKAENAFKTALKAQPDSEEAVINLAFLYNERGEPGRAVQTLNSVAEPSRSAKIYSVLGYTYEQQRDYKKAVESYRKAVQLDADNLEAMRGLAQNLLNDGQTEAALEQYKQIAEADTQDPQSFLRMAEIYRRTGKFALAHEALKKAEVLVGDSQQEIPYSRALVYEAEGKYLEAAQVLQKLLDADVRPDGNYTPGQRNNRAVFLERLGVVNRAAGKLQPAIDAFRKMLESGSDENISRGYQHLIDTYRENKQYDQALATAKEAVAKLPNERTLKLVLASQLADMNQGDEAVAQARALLKNDESDGDREVYIALSQIYSRLRRWKEAEESLAQAEKLARAPEEKDYVAMVAGSIYERQKKYDQAEQAFRRVLQNDPQNPIVLNYLGYMLADRGVRLDEAVAYIKKALVVDPQNGAYLDSLGWAYFRQGKMELAEEYLRKAVERVPNDATIHDHLGDVYQKTGRLKQAVVHWQRALTEWSKSAAADVDNNEVAKVQKKLESAKVRLARQND